MNFKLSMSVALGGQMIPNAFHGGQRSTEVKDWKPCKHGISTSESCLNFKLSMLVALGR